MINHREIEFNWCKSHGSGISINQFTIFNHKVEDLNLDEVVEFLKCYWNNPRGADGIIVVNKYFIGSIPEDYNAVLVCVITEAAYYYSGKLIASHDYWPLINKK